MSFILQTKEYRNLKGVYFIRCYDGVFKIGCSNNLEQRLLSYQGIYWDLKIINVWQTDYPSQLEHQLHLITSNICNKIRKGKYEIFKFQQEDELEQVNLECGKEYIKFQENVQDLLDRGIQICQEETEIVANIDKQIDQLVNSSIIETEIQTNINSKKTNKSKCLWKTGECLIQTTHKTGFCHHHRQTNRESNNQRSREYGKKKKQQLIDANTLIIKTNDVIFDEYKELYLNVQLQSTNSQE